MKKLILFILLSIVILSEYRIENTKIYYEGELVKNIDIKSFEILADNYARDKNSVYLRTSRLENSNPSTFILLIGGYAKDKSNVYHMDFKIKEADAMTFKFKERVVPPSFNNIKDENYYYDSEDKYNNYSNGEIVKKK